MPFRNKVIAGVSLFAIVVIAAAALIYPKVVSDVPDKDAPTHVQEYANTRGERFCEIFLIGGNAITRDLFASAYNTTGYNYGAQLRDSCPNSLIKGLDFDKYKQEHKVLAVYFNKPRFWAFDHMKNPVGPTREFDGIKAVWMGLGIIPKEADVSKPGWLTYRKSPVAKKTVLTYAKGKPVFILDDEQGKPWVMKSFRDAYDQTYETLPDLGKRYQRLPAGWKFRVVILDSDLVIDPAKAGVTSLITQDEFENTFDYVGDGSSNFLP